MEAKTESNDGGKAEQISQLDALLTDEFDPVAAGVGDGKPGSSPGAKSSSAETGAVLGGLVAVVCNVVSARRGDHWQLKPEESEAVGDAAAAVLDKYVPNVEAGPEFALVMVCLGVFGPRLLVDMSQQSQQPKPEQEPGKKDGDKSKSQSGK